MENYKIEVMMTPDNSHGSFCPPYFWCVLHYVHGKWCNCGHGWASSPPEAWEAAYAWCDNILSI